MNILVTNYDNSGDNVLIIQDENTDTVFGVATVIAALTAAGKHFDDIYEIKDEECRYYLYEPLFADVTFTRNMKAASDRCSKEDFRAAADRIGYRHSRS